VKASDLAQWLESQVGREVRPTKERATQLVSRVMEGIQNIRRIAVDLSEEDVSGAVDSAERSKIEIARNFGARIVGVVDGVQQPEPITYDALTEFLSNIRKFQSELLYAGSIWIRKLDQRYKEDVRKMEIGLSDVRAHGRMLEEHVDRRYRGVRKYETLLRDVETLKTFSDEIARLEDEISQTKSQRENLQVACEELDEELRRIERSDKLLKVSQLESAVHRAREEIVSLFRPLEKPVDKLLKLSEREKQKLNPTVAATLSGYLRNPVESLGNSTVDYRELRLALDGLESMLEANLLDLKDSRVRGALKSISRIRDDANLDALREKYLKATQAYEAASQSSELRSLYLRREEFQSKRTETGEALAKLDRALSSLQARKDELTKRLAHLRAAIEESIREVTGQSIRISDLPSMR